MAVTRIQERRFEDGPGGRGPALALSALGLFGLAILMLYILLAEPQAGTAMSAIRDVLRGLGGRLCYALPLLAVWPGAVCIYEARGGKVSRIRTLVDVFMVLCVFAAVHVFAAPEIDAGMSIHVFANFVHKSYGSGLGGGAIGALLGWPLYRYLGVAGGFIGALLAVVICLTATGRLPRWIGYFTSRGEDEGETWTPPRREDRPTPPPRRRAPARDPMSEMTQGVQRPRQARRRPRPMPQEGFEARGERRGEPRRRPAPARRQTVEPMQAAEPVKPVRPRKKKLYIENVETPEPPKVDPFDTMVPLDAETILKEPEDELRTFQPDRPSVTKKEEIVEPEVIDIPEAENLKIEPQPYEAEEDDAPFDVPAPKKAAKKEAKVEKIEKVDKIEKDEMKVMLEDDAPEYNYPPIDLLASGETEDVSKHARRDREKAQLLEETLQSFGISARLTGIAHGPAVTRFELQPAPGIKVSRITSLSDDIALNLAAMSVRIEAPIPGKAAVGVEIPNDKVEMVRLRDVLESQEARKHPSRIAVGLGKDNSGRYIVADIAKMPHVLIAGQTGSGKSVCINAIIASILFRASPEEVRLILIDPKVVELSIYNDIPHLVCPVVTDPKKAASALDWAVAEMTKRYKLFAEEGVRDIKGYNARMKEKGEKCLPQMVIIIDELADLMMVSPGEVEDSICRIAQLARACGMHLVIATQRPSVNVITGIIKANIPTRIAFSVASQVDSRTMIDHGGAEKLLGNGDMLFVPNGMKSMRVQGAWVSDDEVHAMVEYIKQGGTAAYDPDMIEHMENATKTDAEKDEMANEYDPRLPEAVDIVLDLGQASISMLQRRMRIGYARAGRLIDEMARRGIVSEADGAKPRSVLITRAS